MITLREIEHSLPEEKIIVGFSNSCIRNGKGKGKKPKTCQKKMEEEK